MLTSVLAIFYVLLAAITTIHILFNKSDVRAAIGWIGITWFFPFVESIIYYAFGINRVARKAMRNKHANLFGDKSGNISNIDMLGSNADVKDIALIGDHLGVDFSRFSAAPGSHLSGYLFESQGAFPS